MGNTKIEWCDKTWSPVTGCTPISEGCQNCYAQRMANRLRGRCGYPSDDPFHVTFHQDRLGLPLNWKKPSKIFVNSMGDLFHKDIPLRWIDLVLDVIGRTPQHIYQILTKRANLIEGTLYGINNDHQIRTLGNGDYLRNLWLGVTVENEKYKDRIDILRSIPSAVRFISFEPLLGDVGDLDLTGIHWVIVGGETGPKARPMGVNWALNIFRECRSQGVPLFFKKMGNGGIDKLCGMTIREFPK